MAISLATVLTIGIWTWVGPWPTTTKVPPVLVVYNTETHLVSHNVRLRRTITFEIYNDEKWIPRSLHSFIIKYIIALSIE